MTAREQELPHGTVRGHGIAERFNDCIRLFDNYLDIDVHLNLQESKQLKRRLEVWADYTGVKSRAGLTLDDRLLEYSDVKDAIIGLLQLIASKLEEALRVDESEHIEVDATNSETDMIAEADILNRWRNYEDTPWKAIDTSTEMLLELASAIRKSTIPINVTETETHYIRDDDAYFLDFFQTLVRRQLREARYSLTNHIGQSIYIRRKRLLYTQRHEEKLRYPESRLGSQPTQDQSSNRFGSNTPAAIVNDPISIATPSPKIPRPGLAPSHTELSQMNRSLLYRRIGTPGPLSGRTGISSFRNDLQVTYPPLPEAEPGEKWCKCPYCFKLLRVADLDDLYWRKHVDLDVQPFVCISEKCQKPSKFFARQSDWIEHMVQIHGEDWTQKCHMMTWYCDIGHDPRTEFNDEKEAREHYENEHKDIDDLRINAFVRRKRGIGQRDPLTCPFCEQCPEGIPPDMNHTDKISMLHDHMGLELKALAFYSLPSLDADPPADLERSSDGAVPTDGSSSQGSRSLSLSSFNNSDLNEETIPPFPPEIQSLHCSAWSWDKDSSTFRSEPLEDSHFGPIWFDRNRPLDQDNQGISTVSSPGRVGIGYSSWEWNTERRLYCCRLLDEDGNTLNYVWYGGSPPKSPDQSNLNNSTIPPLSTNPIQERKEAQEAFHREEQVREAENEDKKDGEMHQFEDSLQHSGHLTSDALFKNEVLHHWTSSRLFQGITVVRETLNPYPVTICWEQQLHYKVPDSDWICCNGHANSITGTPYHCSECLHMRSSTHCKEPNDKVMLQGAEKVPQNTWVCCNCYWSFGIAQALVPCVMCGHQPNAPHCYGPGTIMLSGKDREDLKSLTQERRLRGGDTPIPWFKVAMAGPSEERTIPSLIIGCGMMSMREMQDQSRPMWKNAQLALMDEYNQQRQLKLVCITDVGYYKAEEATPLSKVAAPIPMTRYNLPSTPGTGVSVYGQSRASEHPVRQPRGPPPLEELRLAPTTKHEDCKNFRTLRHRLLLSSATPQAERPSKTSTPATAESSLQEPGRRLSLGSDEMSATQKDTKPPEQRQVLVGSSTIHQRLYFYHATPSEADKELIETISVAIENATSHTPLFFTATVSLVLAGATENTAVPCILCGCSDRRDLQHVRKTLRPLLKNMRLQEVIKPVKSLSEGMRCGIVFEKPQFGLMEL